MIHFFFECTESILGLQSKDVSPARLAPINLGCLSSINISARMFLLFLFAYVCVHSFCHIFHSLLNSQIIFANQPELGLWTYFPRLNMGRWNFPSQVNFFSTSLHDLNRGWGFVCETSLAISLVFAIYTFVEPFWLFCLILDCVYSWGNVNISFKCLPTFYLISNFPGVESRYLFGFLDQTCNKFVAIL